MAAVSEDSVLSSLDELKQMAKERARRDSEQFGPQDRLGHARRRTGELPAPDSGEIPGPRRWSPPPAYAAPAHGSPAYGSAARRDPYYETPPMAPAKRSAAGPVFLTIILLGAGGGAGYWKLQQDFQAALAAKDQALLAVEQAKGQAVEKTSRAEQQNKVQFAACQDEVKSLKADNNKLERAALAAVTPPPAPPKAAARKPEPRKPEPRKVAAVEEKKPEEKKIVTTMPKIAKKKKVGDDPLAGIKL